MKNKHDGVDKIAEVFLKILVASSGGSSIYFLFNDQISKAIISGFMAFFATLLTSFGEGVTAYLKERLRQRGKETGIIIDQAIDSVVESSWKGLTGFRDQYLEAVRTYCYDLEVEGFKGDLPPLSLEDVFIPVNLDSDPNGILKGRVIKNFWAFLPLEDGKKARVFPKKMVVIADPGFGKTTLTRYLALCYANRSFVKYGVKELLPVLLPLRSIYLLIKDVKSPSLSFVVIEQIKKLPQCQNLKATTAWFDRRIKDDECLIMFDGLDEIPSNKRKLVSEWINWQMQEFHGSTFLLTSRPHGFRSELFTGVQRFNIVKFNNEQKKEFILKWYEVVTRRQKWDLLLSENINRPKRFHLSKSQVNAQIKMEARLASEHLIKQVFQMPEINYLAENPLLVTIIAATHRAFDKLPTRRIRLYEKMFGLLLEDRPNRREVKLTIQSSEDNMLLLQALALQLTIKNKVQFTLEEGIIWIEPRLKRLGLDVVISPDNFLNEIQTIAGLIAGSESNLYQFTHKTFQEYLAAMEIKRLGEGRSLLKSIGNPSLEEVHCFFSSLTSVNPYIQIALKKPTEKNLKLVHRMVKEGGRTDPQYRESLENALLNENLASSEVKLARRLRAPKQAKVAQYLDLNPVSWDEYELFVEDQISGQFHSTAKVVKSLKGEENSPVKNIKFSDAQWFCAWLTAKSNAVEKTSKFIYRIQDDLEIRTSPVNDILKGKGLFLACETIKNEYNDLLQYLANGLWHEADEETFRLMLKIANCESEAYLTGDALRSFPCGELSIINDLWLKFSGGHFGFSVQKEIYIEAGNSIEGKYRKSCHSDFLRKLGWVYSGVRRSKNIEIFYSLKSPRGHLPGFRAWESGKVFVGHSKDLFFRMKSCNI